MATLRLIKTYRVLSILYRGEIKNLDQSEYRRLNVIWNNTLCRIFDCCWREYVSSLLIHSCTLPTLHLIDQCKILFWKKVLISDNIAVCTLAEINKHVIGSIMSKYGIRSINIGKNAITQHVWVQFVVDVLLMVKLHSARFLLYFL